MTCTWQHCEGWTIEWCTGLLRRCADCGRFATDEAAATAATAFIASFEVLPREQAHVPCNLGCRGWSIVRTTGPIAGWEIAPCLECGIYADQDQALLEAQDWLLEHLRHPERFPRKVKHLAVASLPGLVIARFGRFGCGTPTAEEWASYVAVFKTPGPVIDWLIWTEGGWPNRAQRHQVDAVLGDRTRTAFVSSRPWVLSGVRVFHAFDALVGAFGPDQIDEALVFLGALQSRASVVASLDRLHEGFAHERPPQGFRTARPSGMSPTLGAGRRA